MGPTIGWRRLLLQHDRAHHGPRHHDDGPAEGKPSAPSRPSPPVWAVDYNWTGPDAYTSDATAGADTLEMLWAGDYELTVSYSSGCVLGTTTVTEIPQIAISAVIGMP